MSRTNALDNMFKAKSIAVIGASNIPCKAPHQIIKNMIKKNFKGMIFPVYPAQKVERQSLWRIFSNTGLRSKGEGVQ